MKKLKVKTPKMINPQTNKQTKQKNTGNKKKENQLKIFKNHAWKFSYFILNLFSFDQGHDASQKKNTKNKEKQISFYLPQCQEISGNY